MCDVALETRPHDDRSGVKRNKHTNAECICQVASKEEFVKAAEPHPSQPQVCEQLHGYLDACRARKARLVHRHLHLAISTQTKAALDFRYDGDQWPSQK